MRLPAMAMVLALGVGPVHAGDAGAVVAEARRACESLGGALKVGRGAVRRLDLDGDGVRDALVDAGRLTCTSSASLFCGTGGCAVTAIVNGRHSEFLARGWKRVNWDRRPVLLLAVHGSECGGVGADRCVKSVVFSPDGPRSIGGAGD